MSEEILYHYTSAEGLLGIIKTNKIWATDYNFLNDSKEVHEGLELFKRSFKTFIDDHNVFEEEIGKFISSLNIYIFSLTSLRDNVRQWMSYCPPNSGYCIGFKKSSLEDLIKKSEEQRINQALMMEKVKYNEDFDEYIKSSTVLYDMILPPQYNEIIQIAYDKEVPPEDLQQTIIRRRLTKHIIRYLVSKKRCEFSNEEESRIISLSLLEKNTGFRCKSGIIIPYREIEISKEFISEIIIGPSINRDLAMRGIKELLERNQIRTDIVHMSDCSLRVF